MGRLEHISGPQDTSYTGVSVPSVAINIGKSLTSHLVLGGGIFFDYTSSVTAHVGGQSGDAGTGLIPLGLGAFADYYLDPHRGGLHFQAFLGWGGAESTENTGGSDPTGLTVYAGAGWDKFISSEMSIGVLGRLGYGSWSISGADYTWLSPSVLGTVTWH